MLGKIVAADPKGWEGRKKKLKNALPLSNEALENLSHRVSRFHQRFFQDFVFIHINKCGGTAIERALGIPLLSHDTAAERRKTIGERRWRERYKFSVVRNPYERIASCFLYVGGGKHNYKQDAPRRYEAWLETIYDKVKGGELDRNTHHQMSWIADESGTVLVDRVYRLEKLDAEIEELGRSLNRKISLQRVNDNKRQVDYDSLYTPRSLQLINRMHAEDFDQFDYAMVGAR
jgi:hypothetical protein